MADLIIKPNSATGDKLILQDRAGGAVLTTADSGISALRLGPGSAPGSPAQGTMYYDSSGDLIKVWDGAKWVEVGGKQYVTGGTEHTFGTYTVHEFTGDGIFSIVGVALSCEILVVGGGGGTANDHAAGAGAGGLLYGTLTLNGDYHITVGAGGVVRGPNENRTNETTWTTYHGNKGSNSVISRINAIALGGGGGGTNYSGQPDSNGGSGGGGGGQTVPGLKQQSDSGGLTGFGYNGGIRDHSTSSYTTGGGGGAGAVGGTPVNGSTTAAGGAGKDYSSIFGTGVGASGWFAGGGGGGHYSDSGGTGASAIAYGAGGQGGGGRGGNTGNDAVDGTPNTGGGGGGADRNDHGGSGGSGVVVIRHLT